MNANVTDCKLFIIALKMDEVSWDELYRYCLLTECGKALKWLRISFAIWSKKAIKWNCFDMLAGKKIHFPHFKFKYDDGCQ